MTKESEKKIEELENSFMAQKQEDLEKEYEQNFMTEFEEYLFVGYEQELIERREKSFQKWKEIEEKNYRVKKEKRWKEILELRKKCYELIYDGTKEKKDTVTEQIAMFIERNYYIYTTKNDLKTEVWFYDDDVYKPNGISKIKEISRMILDFAYTSQRVNSVIDKIKADTFIEEEVFFNSNIIDEQPVLNGVLNLKTKELSEFTPKKIFFNKVPVFYDRTATCPKIDQFFDDVLRCSEDKQVMYEMLGRCLYKENFIEKAFMFNGSGRNGKSKTLILLKIFLGVENTCSVPLPRLLPNSFSVCELFGKLANIAGDLDEITIKDTGTIKSLTGRDLIGATRKFLSEIYFINYSQQIFACNTLPKVYDTSLGFWSRWVLLDFPYTFISKKEYEELQDKINFKIRNEDIINKIATQQELSGLLNKALEGLDRLFTQHDYSYTKGTQEVKDTWIRKSDSFVAFCIDKLEESIEEIILKKDLRKKYVRYCKTHKISGTSDKAMKVTLEKLFGAVTYKDSITGEYYWEGAKFKFDGKI